MNFQLRLRSLLLAATASLLLAGCVNVAGASLGASTIVFLIALLGLGVAACTDDTASNKDAGWNVEEDTGESDVRDARDGDVEGNWESCCENGQVSSCFCPANMACNYGMYSDCGDGTCSLDPAGCGFDDAGDTGDTGDATDTSDVGDATDTSDTSDASDTSDTADTSDTSDASDARDGTWQPCCNNGEVDTCFCPTGVACNYGWYSECDDGTCVLGGPDQCDADAGQ